MTDKELEGREPTITLSERVGQWFIPAIHLWWRFFWRIVLWPLFLTLLIGLAAWFFGYITHPPHVLGITTLVVGMGFLWIFWVPIMVAYGVWLLRGPVFRKPFLYRNTPHVFVVRHGRTALGRPLPLEFAAALWWAVTWRAWVGTVTSMMLLFFLGPLHAFLQIGVSFGAFLWFLSFPYGSTRVSCEPLAAP